MRPEEIESAANTLSDFYNSMSFGLTQMFVLIEFDCPHGRYYEGEFGYVLEQLALGSKWFSLPKEYPAVWPQLRQTITNEQLEKINDIRRRHNMASLL